MRRKIFLTLLLLGSLALIAGCAVPAPAPDTGDEGGAVGQDTGPKTLRLGINAADLGTLDPHYAATTNDRTVVDMIFNGLLRYAPGDAPNIEPDLATAIPEPETVDGQQVWTFELRQGVMCHPGPETDAYELTADDVVYSLQKSANTERSAYAGEYEGVTVEKVDDYTVNVILDTPLSANLFHPKVADYAGGFIVCSQAVEAMGDEAFTTYPVGTGPFMFAEYTPQEMVRLVANPDYFRGQPNLDEVRAMYMPDISSRELGLRAGEVDVIHGQAEEQWIEATDNVEDLTVEVFGVGEVATIHFNTTVEPLDNPDVRRALAYGLDRDTFLALFGESVAENVCTPVPPQFMPGGIPCDEVAEMGLAYTYDPDMAQQLLADAGYPDGFALEVVSSEMAAYSNNYQSLQAQLSEIGVDLTVNIVDHASMHSLIREDANPIIVYIAFRPNADVYLTRFFHSDSIVVTGASPDTNFSHYDAIDDLIEQARSETDAEEQVRLWEEAQVQILEDMVALPLHYQNLVYARSDSVDYGHPLNASLALYPQITENTDIAE